MSRSTPKTIPDIPAALARFRRQWDRVAEKPGLDRIAKAAAMSNNSVLDLSAPVNHSRNKDLIRRLTKGGRPESNVRTWARLAMQLAMALGDGNVNSWVNAEEWGLSPEEFARVLEEGKAKINRAEEQLSGTITSERIRVGIVPLVFLADDTRPKRGQYIETTTNASFLGAFARLALRSVKPEYEFEYAPIESLRELNPHQGDGASRALKVGVFGIVARELDTFEHIPIPGWRYRFACMGPDVGPIRRAADERRVFLGTDANLLYLSVEDSSPRSFLQSMFGRTLPQKRLDCNYTHDDIAAAYAAELRDAKAAIAGNDSGPVPLLVIDEAMADEVARYMAEQYAPSLAWVPPQFIDLLRDLPEGPTVPICIQVRREDKDLIRLLRRAVIDERSQPGEVFTLGALPTARTYARALVWVLSRYTYDYARGPGVPSSASLLSHVQTYFGHISSQVANDVGGQPPRMPGFCRLWNFDQRTAPPCDFVHLLADELVSRLIPRERYESAVHNSTDQGAAIKAILRLILPSDWFAIIDGSWTKTRFGRPPLVRIPGPQDDWRDGPAEMEHPAR